MGDVRVGIAGWSYADWKGKVYPAPAPRGFDPLVYVTQHFNLVEVNSSFYGPPTPRTTEAWAARTPDGFLFTAKLWERFTHASEPFQPAEVQLFREGMAPLIQARKLGALLLQFPWAFHDGPAERERIRRIAGAFAGSVPLAIELRHRSWLDALDFIREQSLSFCNIDQPRSTTSITGTGLVTGSVGYVRLHGRNARSWFKRDAGRDDKYDYLYTTRELKEWADRIGTISADRVFVVTNNHFQGKAYINALQLKKLLGQGVEVPPTLAQAYPDAVGQ